MCAALASQGSSLESAVSKRQRANGVAAPGAPRLELFGTLLASDDFGRLRLLLVDELPNDSKDLSAFKLREACGKLLGLPSIAPLDDNSYPYKLTAKPEDNCWGTCHIVVPKRHLMHWASEAQRWRGKRVRMEVTLRKFAMQEVAQKNAREFSQPNYLTVFQTDFSDAQTNAQTIFGISLDLSIMELING